MYAFFGPSFSNPAFSAPHSLRRVLRDVIGKCSDNILSVHLSATLAYSVKISPNFYQFYHSSLVANTWRISDGVALSASVKYRFGIKFVAISQRFR